MHRLGFAALLLAACEPMEPSGAPLRPVVEAPAAAPATSTASATPANVVLPGDDVFGDERDETDAKPVDPSDLSALYAGLGVKPGSAPAPASAPTPVVVATPAPAPSPAPVAAAPAGSAPWQAGQPAFAGSWGLRLLSTTASAQPPRAIVGLSDGTEVVVEPGTMLPDAHAVVLAIGRDAIQIAEVHPEGDRTRVATQTLSALHAEGSEPR